MNADHTPLQFETAQTPAAAASASCASCKQPIASTYFTVGGQVTCERCKAGVELALRQGQGARGALRALALGSVAGLVGAAAWYAIRAATGYELGIVALALGWGVGRAVRIGSGGLGGRGYQVLAVALAYIWIAANYVPNVAAQLAASGPNAAAEGAAAAVTAIHVLGAMVIALALPFLGGLENFIGILIIGFGLYQAWVMNRRVAIAIDGPYSLAPGGNTSA